MNKNEYWVNLSDQHKRMALSYVRIVRFEPEEDWNCYLEIQRFKEYKIKRDMLPDWMDTVDEKILRKFIDQYTSPEVKRMIQELRENGKL